MPLGFLFDSTQVALATKRRKPVWLQHYEHASQVRFLHENDACRTSLVGVVDVDSSVLCINNG